MFEAIDFLHYLRHCDDFVCNFHVPFLAQKLQLKEVSLTVTKVRIDIMQQNANLDIFLELFEEHRKWFVRSVMWYRNRKLADNQMLKLEEKTIGIDN